MATKKTTSIFLLFDFLIQLVVFGCVMIGLITIILSASWYDFLDNCTGIFLYSMMFLGPWQLLGGFWKMLIYRDKQKAYYFFGALGYVSSLGYLKKMPHPFALAYFLVGSWSFATWYFWKTWQEIGEDIKG